MGSKVLEWLFYVVAIIIILLIISSAIRVEEDYKKKQESVDEITTYQPATQIEKQDLTSEIIFTSQSDCLPCRAFERDCVDRLRKAGWRVTKLSPDGRATPSFDLRLNGRIVESKTGYRGRSSFFAWIRKAVETNQ